MEVDDDDNLVVIDMPSPTPSIATIATMTSEFTISGRPIRPGPPTRAASVPPKRRRGARPTAPTYPEQTVVRNTTEMEAQSTLAGLAVTVEDFEGMHKNDWWLTRAYVGQCKDELDVKLSADKRRHRDAEGRYDAAKRSSEDLENETDSAKRRAQDAERRVRRQESVIAHAMRECEAASAESMDAELGTADYSRLGTTAWAKEQALGKAKRALPPMLDDLARAKAQYRGALEAQRDYAKTRKLHKTSRSHAKATAILDETKQFARQLNRVAANGRHYGSMRRGSRKKLQSLKEEFNGVAGNPSQHLATLRRVKEQAQTMQSELLEAMHQIRIGIDAARPCFEALDRDRAKSAAICSRSRRDSELFRARLDNLSLADDPYNDSPLVFDSARASGDARPSSAAPRPQSRPSVNRRSGVRLVPRSQPPRDPRNPPPDPPRNHSATQPIVQPQIQPPFIEDARSAVAPLSWDPPPPPPPRTPSPEMLSQGFRPASQWQYDDYMAPPSVQAAMSLDFVDHREFKTLAKMDSDFLPLHVSAIHVRSRLPNWTTPVIASEARTNEAGPIRILFDHDGLAVGHCYDFNAQRPRNADSIASWRFFDLWRTSIVDGWLGLGTFYPNFDGRYAAFTKKVVLQHMEIHVLLPRLNGQGMVTSWWGACMSTDKHYHMVRTHVMVPFDTLRWDNRLYTVDSWPRCHKGCRQYARFVMNPEMGPLGIHANVAVRMTRNAKNAGGNFAALEVVEARVTKGGGWMLSLCPCTAGAFRDFQQWYCRQFGTRAGRPSLPPGLQYAFTQKRYKGTAKQFGDDLWRRPSWE